MISSILKKRILFGVYVIYFVRKLKSPIIAESFIFMILAMILSIFVSFSTVLTNMWASKNYYDYFAVSFSNTDFIVKILLVLVAITALFFVRNLAFYTLKLKHRLA